MARLIAPITLGIFTILAILLLTSSDDALDDTLAETFEIDAVYYNGNIEITFLDRSEQTEYTVMEILGMRESFQRQYTGYEFTETVPFLSAPKYGWEIHPVVLIVEHPEFGQIQIKTEIHNPDEPAPPVIYS